MKNSTLALIVFSVFLTACNFHEVDPGKFYRSAQLDGVELQKAIDKAGIKTVINLRGARPGESWYDEEKMVTDGNGVLLIDIAMSAKRLPHRNDLIKLLDAYKTAPRPILIHCQAGADRTGEATALYQMLYMGYSKQEALNALTPEFMHMQWKYPAKRYFIDKVWRGEQWARDSYNPCSGEYKYYDVNQPECQEAGSDNPPSDDEDT